MKKPFILLMILINIQLICLSQITVSSTDMPVVGNMINKSLALTTGTVDYTLTGANHTWDFSLLTPVSQSVDTFVSVLSTPIFYYPSFITSADKALKQPNINMVIAQMS
ncbi:MAG: hypothetical protein ACOYOV_08145, partial [Bacteroidales bacterium]